MVRFEFFFVSVGKTSLFRSFRFVRVNLGARAPLEFEMIYYYGLCLLSSSFFCCFPSCFLVPERKCLAVSSFCLRGAEKKQKIFREKTKFSLSLSHK